MAKDAPKFNKKRTEQEYENGTAKPGRYYDADGNSYDAGLWGKTRTLNKTLKKYGSFSVDKDGYVKGHTDGSGTHKSWQDAFQSRISNGSPKISANAKTSSNGTIGG